MRVKPGIVLSLAALLCVTGAANAYESYSCTSGGCHGPTEAFDITGSAGTIDLGAGDGLLKYVDVDPGSNVDLSADVTYVPADAYVVQVETLGALPLVQGLGSSWTSPGADKYRTGLLTGGGTSTFDLAVDALQSDGYYLFKLGASGKGGGAWTEGEQFYVHVVPEPISALLLAGGAAVVVLRRRRRT